LTIITVQYLTQSS